MTSDLLLVLLAALTGTVAVARGVRLITSDTWPPILALRLRWLTWAAQTPRRKRWEDLFTCPFCFAPYATAVNVAWALYAVPWEITDNTWSAADWWWIVNGWAAVSYLAAMLVVRDEPVDDEPDDE